MMKIHHEKLLNLGIHLAMIPGAKVMCSLETAFEKRRGLVLARCTD